MPAVLAPWWFRRGVELEVRCPLLRRRPLQLWRRRRRQPVVLKRPREWSSGGLGPTNEREGERGKDEEKGGGGVRESFHTNTCVGQQLGAQRIGIPIHTHTRYLFLYKDD